MWILAHFFTSRKFQKYSSILKDLLKRHDSWPITSVNERSQDTVSFRGEMTRNVRRGDPELKRRSGAECYCGRRDDSFAAAPAEGTTRDRKLSRLGVGSASEPLQTHFGSTLARPLTYPFTPVQLHTIRPARMPYLQRCCERVRQHPSS